METVGLIPSAGKGSRLGLPFSKEMFPDVHNESYRPIIMHTIDAMKRSGIEHLIFTINPKKKELIEYLGNGKQFGMNFSYCIHPEPRSLPESLHESYHLIKGKRVVFAMPDTVIKPDSFIDDMIYAHEHTKNTAATLGLFKTDTPNKFAMVDFEGEKATYAIEKPKKSDLKWMWGSMVWGEEYIERFHQYVEENKYKEREGEMMLTNSLTTLIQERKVTVVPFEYGEYRDLGTYSEIINWATIKQ
ncbi:sugar phosphate nucleotidyltransferase [Ornithinibacillus contaminans]|uniref:sugar phosphate nucleotidyltransferase n=1 Tax=Ornithinibacillus contaminans TaxID=694055 RepID=UPI00064D9781|nr:sugar phosphate nucleotidyltransferase [Ornithinibacillus contaminans]